MKVAELVEQLDVEVITGKDALEQDITTGFIGDLLSVVMGKASAGCAWVTIQSHINIIAVATLVDVACIIVSEGFSVDDNAIEKAEEEGVVILTTKASSYEVAKAMAELGV